MAYLPRKEKSHPPNSLRPTINPCIYTMATHMWRAVVEVYNTASLWKDMPFVFASGGVAIVGSIALFAIYAGLEYCLLKKQRRNQFLRTGPKNDAGIGGWRQRHWHMYDNVMQTVLRFTFIILLGFIIWVAGAVVGFNSYSTATAMLVMGIVLTYTFAGPLGAWGYSMALMIDNQLYVGQHWEFHGTGPGWDGIISGIYTFEVEMMHQEDDGRTTIVTVPIANFFNAMRKSDPEKQRKWGDIYRPANDARMVEQLGGKIKNTRRQNPAEQNDIVPASQQMMGDPLDVRVTFKPSSTSGRLVNRAHARAPELLAV